MRRPAGFSAGGPAGDSAHRRAHRGLQLPDRCRRDGVPAGLPPALPLSMGVGGTLVALFSAVVAITVLPAILALLGHRVNALTPKRLQRHADADARPSTSGFWYRLSRFVMRRPVAIAMAAAAVLIVAGLPFLRIEFTSADAGSSHRSVGAHRGRRAQERLPARPHRSHDRRGPDRQHPRRHPARAPDLPDRRGRRRRPADADRRPHHSDRRLQRGQVGTPTRASTWSATSAALDSGFPVRVTGPPRSSPTARPAWPTTFP